MRIVCPSCRAAYEVPDAAIATPRVMRCSRCAHEFASPQPPAAESEIAPAAPETPAQEAPTADTPDAVPGVPPAVSAALKTQVLAAWGASFLVLLVLTGAGIAWRRPVMHAWPASARLYSALGFLQ